MRIGYVCAINISQEAKKKQQRQMFVCLTLKFIYLVEMNKSNKKNIVSHADRFVHNNLSSSYKQ